MFGLYDKHGKEYIVDLIVKDSKGDTAVDYCVERRNELLHKMVVEYAKKTGQEVQDSKK